MTHDFSAGVISGLELLFALDAGDLIQLFWFMVVFELPRYFIGAMICLAYVLRQRGVITYADPAKDDDPSPPGVRKFSVIIAGHNEVDVFRKCVMSVLEQTAMYDRVSGMRLGEIVVIDDGSTDGTAGIVADLRREGLIDTGLSLQLRGGKSAATNLALKHCHHPFIIIVDADTTFDRDAFERLLKPFDDPAVGAVGGNLFVRNADATLTTTYQDIEYRIGISLGRRISEMLDMLGVVSGAFGAFRRTALDEVGGFDVEIGEDADLTMKLRQAGWRIAFQPSAYAGTDVPETVPGLIRQRLRWDHSIVTIWLRKYGHLVNPLHNNFNLPNALVVWDAAFLQVIISVVFFIYLGWIIAVFHWFAIVIITATLAVYLVLSAIMLLIAAIADDHRHALRLFPHLPYFVLFSCFVMRAVRLYSAVDEWIFRSSFRDSYVPRRVMKEVERY